MPINHDASFVDTLPRNVAVQFLEHHILRTGAVLAGGDWKICYSQQDTDNVVPCYPAEQLPFVGTWPPKPGTLTRLGSGTRNRGTFGPATIWRVEAHIGMPRYPWRLMDGSLIRTVGDLVWWETLTANPKLKTLKIPVVIGNYHSHPGDQAEFRAADEHPLLSDPGVSPL